MQEGRRYESMEEMMADKMPVEDLIETYRKRPIGIKVVHQLPPEEKEAWLDNFLVSCPNKNIRKILFSFSNCSITWDIGEAITCKTPEGERRLRPAGIDDAHILPRAKRAKWLSNVLSSLQPLQEKNAEGQYIEVVFEKDPSF